MNVRNINPYVSTSMRAREAKMRLFCFPYAGGSSHIFRDHHQHLPSAVEVCPVQLPGRGTRLREPPFTSLAPLVSAVADALGPLLDKPFALYGHSMGAMISYELARHFRRARAAEPVHLFVSGCRAPHLPNTRAQTYALPDDQFVEELRRLNGTPEELLRHPELVQLMIPVLRADFSVCQTYVYTPEPPLNCPITAFGGAGDPETSQESLDAWREQTGSSFSAYMFPGDHFFINKAQPDVLRIISRDLRRVGEMLSRAESDCR